MHREAVRPLSCWVLAAFLTTFAVWWGTPNALASDGVFETIEVVGLEHRFRVLEIGEWAEAPIALTCSVAKITDGAGGCCLLDDPPCEPSGIDLSSGDTALMSIYWDDVIPDPYPGGFWVVDQAIGVVPVSGSPTVLFDAPFPFGDLSDFAGETLRFCSAIAVTVPALGEDVVANVGASVESPDGSLTRFPCACFCVNETDPSCEC